MTRPPATRHSGFTLLEVLVALSILSLAVVAAIQGFAQGLRLLKLSGDHQQAMLLAEQKAREVVEPTERTEANTDGDFTWERTTKLLDAPDLAPPGTTPRWRVYEIDVRVRWDERRQVELATLRTVAIKTITTPAAPGAVSAPGVTPGTTTPTPGLRSPTTPGRTPTAPGRSAESR